MLKVEKERILLKLDEMERYIDELKELIPDEKEYKENLIKRRACEKTIELAIESMIDVCAMLVSFQNMGPPSDEDDLFDLLIKNKIIKNQIGSKLKEMKGFRNIIVHRYGEVDDALAYEYMSKELDDFCEFGNAVSDYLELLTITSKKK